MGTAGKELQVKSVTDLRRVAAVVAVLSLCTPAAQAVEPESARAGAGPNAALAAIWNRITALWGEEGSYIDPNGNRAIREEEPAPGPSDLQEEGAYIDPKGAA
jgi:hypothetical protein